MIIDDLHIVGVTLAPPEADSPPLVDSDTVLPFPITGQLLETVTWRYPKIRQFLGSIEDQKLATRHPYDVVREAPRREPVED